MHGQLVALERTIRQHEDHLARAHGGNRLVADVLDRAFEAVLRWRVVDVDDVMREVRIVVAERDQLAELGFRQNRRVDQQRSEEHTSELQSLMRSSYAVFCLNKKKSSTPTTVYT